LPNKREDPPPQVKKEELPSILSSVTKDLSVEPKIVDKAGDLKLEKVKITLN